MWDVCLVQTEEEMELNGKTISSISLPSRNLNIENKICQVAGWGLNELNKSPRYLQRTNMVHRLQTDDKFDFECRSAANRGAFCARGVRSGPRQGKTDFT